MQEVAREPWQARARLRARVRRSDVPLRLRTCYIARMSLSVEGVAPPGCAGARDADVQFKDPLVKYQFDERTETVGRPGQGLKARTAPHARGANASMRSSQARDKLHYLLNEGAGPRGRWPAPRGPPLEMPAPPLGEGRDQRLGQLEKIRADMRFALDQAAPSLPVEVRRHIMGYAKAPIDSVRLVKVRLRSFSPCGGRGAPWPPELIWRGARSLARPPPRVAGA